MQKRQFLKTLAFTPVSIPAVTTLSLGLIKAESIRKVTLQRSIIRGFAYYQGNQILGQMRTNDPLTLQREPENKHDSKAIGVYWQNSKLGYLPRNENVTLAQMLDNGQTIIAHIEQIIVDNDWEPLDVVVELVV